MANPTTNFGWVMPTSTDLVTDLPADFNTFGQGVDTTLAELKGGTTGQVLSKTSNTDMDFTWIAANPGDITAVNTTAPLQGGATSGAVTLTVDSASTSATGVVQLSDSTSTTSSVLAATPTAVKSAYDLANAAIAKSTVTTAGDIIYRNGTVPTRLAIGTVGQVLTVATGATAPEWKTPTASSPTFVGCSLYKSANASITNATDTTVTFNSENYDTDGFHDTTTNAERITIPAGKGGKYLITAKITYASNTTGIRGIYLYKNAAVFLTYNSGNLQVSGECNVLLSYVVSLNATDYVYFQTYQNSGGALNLNGGSELTTFQASYLGA